MIIVCPLNKAEALVQQHDASHVISLLGPDTPHRRFGGVTPDRHLRLTFHDIVKSSDGLQPASATDAERLVGFHCELAAREAPAHSLLGRHQPVDGRGLYRPVHAASCRR